MSESGRAIRIYLGDRECDALVDAAIVGINDMCDMGKVEDVARAYGALASIVTARRRSADKDALSKRKIDEWKKRIDELTQ